MFGIDGVMIGILVVFFFFWLRNGSYFLFRGCLSDWMWKEKAEPSAWKGGPFILVSLGNDTAGMCDKCDMA
jgi:hypothetical protein